jgi:uncharacterized membrane protein
MSQQQSTNSPHRWPKTLLWAVMGAMSFFIIVYVEIPLLGQRSEQVYFRTIPFLIIPHIVAGVLALLSGPLQFSRRLRQRSPKGHRLLGRVYVVSVLTAAVLAIILSYKRNIPHATPYFFMASSLQASVWIVTTIMAFLMARSRHITEHRQWIVRSYAVTFTFIGIRVLVRFPFATPHNEVNFALEIVFATFMAIFFSDLGLNWRLLFQRRV